MILDALAAVAVSIITAVLQLVPAYDPGNGITSAGSGFGATLGAGNAVFPIGTLAACLSVMIGLRVFIFLWDLIVSVYKLFPFKAS